MNGALEKNQRLTLSCARLGSELEGVCSYEGMAVFVPGVLPGETAEVQIVKALPNYAFGRLVQVLEPSAQRAQPRCPVYDKCGGSSSSKTGGLSFPSAAETCSMSSKIGRR